MELGRPLAVITPTVDGDVLRVLAQADTQFTPGDLHRLMDRHSLAGVRRVLERLTTQGIVTRRRAGSAYLYQLNRDHLAAEAVIALADLRVQLLHKLSSTVKKWAEEPVFGAVFGSAAQGTQRPDSDLDLFLVRQFGSDDDRWDTQVADLAQDATRWTGNDARVMSFGAQEIREDSEPASVLQDIADQGLVFWGEPLWLRQQLRLARRRTALLQSEL
jgi:predicted nucleotidyltransferase